MIFVTVAHSGNDGMTDPNREAQSIEAQTLSIGLTLSVTNITVAYTGNGSMADPSSEAQSFPGGQPQPKPKRGSPVQFGAVFSPGSANSVSKLTGMFKSKSSKLEKDPSLPPKTRRGVPQKGLAVSEVDLWRPQSAEERQQCMDAYDAKVQGFLHPRDRYTRSPASQGLSPLAP